MVKYDMQFFGGRGGSSGIGGNSISKSLPEPIDFMGFKETFKNIKLEGSEKQVAWAEQIRREAYTTLLPYAMQQDSDGFPSDAYRKMSSKKDMLDSINNNTLIKSISSKDLQQRKISEEVGRFKEMAERFNTAKEILSNRSAKFWIDNRPNQASNYLFKEMKKKIDKK